MKTLLSLLFAFVSAISFSQAKPSENNISIDVDPLFSKIIVKIKSEKEMSGSYKVQVMDLKNNVVKTAEISKAAKQAESQVDIMDLGPGQYSCVVFQGKEELSRKNFTKDMILMEPQGRPVVRKSSEK